MVCVSSSDETLSMSPELWSYGLSYVNVEGRSDEERTLAENKLIERKRDW